MLNTIKDAVEALDSCMGHLEADLVSAESNHESPAQAHGHLQDLQQELTGRLQRIDWLLGPVLDRSVEELDVSVRTWNMLKNRNIRTIRELAGKTEEELLKTKNFGRKSLTEVKEILAEMGLSLAQKPSAITT